MIHRYIGGREKEGEEKGGEREEEIYYSCSKGSPRGGSSIGPRGPGPPPPSAACSLSAWPYRVCGGVCMATDD